MALEGARGVGVEAREGFVLAGNAGRLVGVAARGAGFRPPDDAGLLFAAAATDESEPLDVVSCNALSAGGADSTEAFANCSNTQRLRILILIITILSSNIKLHKIIQKPETNVIRILFKCILASELREMHSPFQISA